MSGADMKMVSVCNDAATAIAGRQHGERTLRDPDKKPRDPTKAVRSKLRDKISSGGNTRLLCSFSGKRAKG